MPADLYLRSTFKALKPDEPERDRFIDTYDKYCLFKLIGLSWQRDVLPMLDKRDCLPLEGAKELRARLEDAEITSAILKSWCETAKVSRPLEEWLHHFQKQRQDLIALLSKSIEANEPLQCNL